KLIKTCNELNAVGLDSKKFILGMLSSTDSTVAHRRGSWGTEYGWVSTHEVLTGFKRLICKDNVSGKQRWASFILQEAKEIVIRENLPSGEPPLGMFYNSQNITHEFFSQDNEELRDGLVAEHMPFLHSIILAKLEHAATKQENKRQASRNDDRKDPE
ncbi:hypothetical protein DFH28DRAFT_826110, partial [Melampsora americana]